MSLDVENLFTNVTVDQTIDITLNSVHNNNSIPLPSIKPKNYYVHAQPKSHSYNHNGNIYT